MTSKKMCWSSKNIEKFTIGKEQKFSLVKVKDLAMFDSTVLNSSFSVKFLLV